VSGKFDDTWVFERLLCDDSDTAARTLLSLYKDKTVVESRSPHESLYSVVPDTRAATRGDSSIAKNLRQQFGIRLDQVAEYHHEETLGTIRTGWSFNHSWALRPLAEQLMSPRAKQPIIIHFDAHDDLASPMIGLTDTNGLFTAPVGDSTLDLRDASTIEEFVLRGFIGIGSFIVPLLHAVAGLEIVHVAQAHSSTAEDLELRLEHIQETTFTGRRLDRPAARIVPPTENTTFRYTRTSDPSIAFQRARHKEVLLDIDLDYFCNVLDNKRADADLTSLPSCSRGTAELIDGLHNQLKRGDVVPSLVTVALSPGFFPSDGWPTVIPRLKEILADI
jgi:hypothetical protein